MFVELDFRCIAYKNQNTAGFMEKLMCCFVLFSPAAQRQEIWTMHCENVEFFDTTNEAKKLKNKKRDFSISVLTNDYKTILEFSFSHLQHFYSRLLIRSFLCLHILLLKRERERRKKKKQNFIKLHVNI